MKDKTIGWITIIGLAILFVFLGIKGVNLTETMINVNKWFYSKIGEIGIYIATFLISIFGNFTIIFPVPYTMSIMSVMATLPVNPFLLSLFAALGSSIGELSAWLFGKGTSEVLKKKDYESRIKGLVELIDKGLAIPLIILYAATPLPDDILLVALGIKGYSLKKTLIAGFIGKLMMILSITYGVFFAKETDFGLMLLNFIGIDISKTGVSSNVFGMISMPLLIIFTLVIIMVDWKKLFRKIKRWFKWITHM